MQAQTNQGPIHPSLGGKVDQPIYAPRVLILCSYERAATSTRYQEDAIRATIEKGVPFARIRTDYVSVVTLPMDSMSAEVKASIGRTLELKHAGEAWDLIVTVDSLAFEVLTSHAPKLLARAPLVFSGLTWDESRVKAMALNATGVFERIDLIGTVNLARRLRPDTSKFLVVAQGSAFGERMRAEAIPQVDALRGVAELEWSKAGTRAELASEIKALGPDGAVLYLSFYDATPGEQDPWGTLTAHNIPLFGVFRTYIDPYMIGGRCIDPGLMGTAAGEMAVRVLEGKPARDIPPTGMRSHQVVVNVSALRRWGIPMSRVPKDAVLLRPEVPWHERYRPFLGWILLGATLQAGVIGLLLVQRVRARKVEAELRTSRERYELAMRNSTEGVWDWDVESDDVYWSGSLREQLGIENALSTSRIGPNKEWERRIHPDDLAATMHSLRAHVVHDAPYDVEYRLKVADGTYRWFRSRGRAIRDPSGRATRMVGSMIDVHERVQADQRVRESEARFRALFERNLDATLIVDEHGHILEANPSADELFSDGTAGIAGRSLSSLTPSTGDRSAREAFEAYLGGEQRGSFALKRAGDIRKIEVEFTAAPIGSSRHMIMCRDVTDRLHFERELRNRERRYRLATETGRVSVWSVNAHTSRVDADPLLVEQLTGDRGFAFPPEADHWFATIHPADRADLYGLFVRCIAGHIHEYEKVVRVVWHDGQTRWLQIRAVAERGADGNVFSVLGTAVDVSERERVIENLRQTQERLQAITDSVPGLVYRSRQVADNRQLIEYVSRGARDVIGIEAAELIGRVIDPRDLVDPEDSGRLMDAASIPAGASGDRQVAYRLRTPAGQVRWVRDIARYHKIDDGTIVWDGIIVDQTEVREAAERLAESERRYRNIVETAEEGIWLVGEDWRTTFVNARMASILGWTPEEMIGRAIDDFMDDEGRALAQENKRRREQGLRDQHEFKFVRRDGEPVWTLISTNPLRDEEDNFKGALAMVTDITELRLARERENEAAEHLKIAMEAGGLGAFSWDVRTGKIVWSEEHARIWGMSLDEFDGRYETFASRVHPGDLRELESRVEEARKNRTAFQHTYRIIRPDIGERWVEGRGRFFFDADGNTVSMSGVIVDITSRVQALRAIERERLLFLIGPAVAWRWRNAEGWPVEHVSENVAALGYSADDFISGRIMFSDIVHPEDLERVGAEVAAHVAHGRRDFEQEYRVRTADGRWRWLADRTVVEYDSAGRATHFAGYTIDFTERLTAEQRLRESEQRLRMLVKSTPLGVIYFNRDFTISDFNPGAERIFGFSAAEVFGRDATFLVPESARPYVKDIWNKLTSQSGGTRGTNQNVRKDGSLIYCEWYNSPLVDESGRVVAVASVVEDVTGRLEAQRQQEMLMVELDHRVKNNLAAVLSLAEQTGASTLSFDEFIRAFGSRLRAMARMHNALASTRWTGVDLSLIVRQTFETYAPGESKRASFDGPHVVLSARASQVLAMTLNELGTNAAKYGALSGNVGRVVVSWTISPASADAAGVLVLEWRETDGPSVAPPTRRGFGTAFIEGAISHELLGSAELEYEPAGLICRIQIPLETGLTPSPDAS